MGGFRLGETTEAKSTPRENIDDLLIQPSVWHNYPLKTGVPLRGLRAWPAPSKSDAEALVRYWASFYGADPNLAVCLVWYESGFNSAARNPSSTAAGLGQFIKSTFNSTAQRMGLPYTYEEYVLNAEVNAQMMGWLLATDGPTHWVVWRSCG